MKSSNERKKKMPDNLTRAAEELRDDVRHLSDALEHHRVAVEKADSRAKVGICIGLVGVALVIAAIWLSLVTREDANDRADETARARVSSCAQFNVQRNEIRTAIKDALLALAPPGVPLTETQQATVARYAREVDAKLPYRDCSPAGIDAYFKAPPSDPALSG